MPKKIRHIPADTALRILDAVVQAHASVVDAARAVAAATGDAAPPDAATHAVKSLYDVAERLGFAVSAYHDSVRREWLGGGLRDHPSDPEGNYMAPPSLIARSSRRATDAREAMSAASHAALMSGVPSAIVYVLAAQEALADAEQALLTFVLYGDGGPPAAEPAGPLDGTGCPESEDGRHEVDSSSIRYTDGSTTPDSTVVDVWCAACGCSGAVVIDHEDIDW